MPISQTMVDGDYYTRRVLNPCTGNYDYSQWSVFDYASDYKIYNDPQHRPYPHPLTNTALNKQVTRKIRPSDTGWFIDAKLSRYCLSGSWKDAWREGRFKGWGQSHTSYVLPWTINVGWESALLQFVKQSYVSLGDSLAEYRSTASMFSRFGKDMWDVAKKLRDIKSFKTRLAFCSVPLAELAYSFGIAPLAEDTFSAVEALKLKLQTPIYVDFHATRTGYMSDSPTWTGYTAVKRRGQVSQRVDARIQLVPMANQITLGNPSTWAWELIPFSFVVDWGIPIGQWLADLDAIRLISGISGTRTVKETFNSTYRITQPKYGGGNQVGTLGKNSFKTHQRFLLTSVPVPPVPSWKPSLSWHKVYRAITLLIAVRGCKPSFKPKKGPWYRYKEFYSQRS